MFLFKKIVAPFLLPPGLLILVSILCALWLARRRSFLGAFFALCISALIWAFSFAPLSDSLVRSLEADFSIPADPKGDVIVVLGGGVKLGAQDIGGRGVPSEEMLARAVAAVRLHKRIGSPIIVSGGYAFGDFKPTEAEIVGKYMVELGIAADKIIPEDKSRDTMENALLTKKVLDSRGFKKPLLVTSAIHMKRSVLSFKRAGVEVSPYPANFRTWDGMIYTWQGFLPQNTDIREALHEYLGLIYLKLAH